MFRIKDTFYIGIASALLVISVNGCTKKENGFDFKPIEGMVYIPAGEFMLGSSDIDTEMSARRFGSRKEWFFEDEKPIQKLNLDAFYMDMYEVTNKQYKDFLDMTGHEVPPDWHNSEIPDNRDNHPVRYVSWYDAYAYCRWKKKRLPTEYEWEKAAKGADGRNYPWGNEYDENKANLTLNDTAPVGSYPEDKSPYGVYDMAGNLMEWTDSWYKAYPNSTNVEKDYGEKYRVLKGGSGSDLGHYDLPIFARTTNRHYYEPTGKGGDGGFRCVKTP
ncbi:MAG: formylglycine-generating enzyme family protein [Thermodesulfobacteriota bacterium]